MVVTNQDQAITDSSTKLTSDDQVIMMNEGYPSDQETGSKSRLNELIMIKKELQKKLGYDHAEKKKPVIDQPQMSVNRVYSIYSKLLHEKALFKWIIIVLNVIIELWQAILSQDLAEGVINKYHYGKLVLISASICLITSIFDVVFEAIEGSVRWQKRGFFSWFYYPGKHGSGFGTFWLGFGLVSSTIQFGFNLVGYVTKGGVPIRFDYFPLLLSVCFLFGAFGHGRKSIWGVVKCDIKHGEYEIEGRFVHGNWLFSCPSCETAVRSV